MTWSEYKVLEAAVAAAGDACVAAARNLDAASTVVETEQVADLLITQSWTPQRGGIRNIDRLVYSASREREMAESSDGYRAAGRVELGPGFVERFDSAGPADAAWAASCAAAYMAAKAAYAAANAAEAAAEAACRLARAEVR